MSCCSLDEESFRLCCGLFLRHADSLRDGWSWEQAPGLDEGYLRKTVLRSVKMNNSPDQGQEGASPALEHQRPEETDGAEQEQEVQQFSLTVASGDIDDIKGDDDDDDDGVCVVAEGSSRVIRYEYHILYSCSYRTPVLYFRAFTLEGRSLSLDEVWNTVHPNYKLRLQQSPWDTITQQEHPLLGQSFFVLHPCRTEEFMTPVVRAAQEEHREVNYVVTWLSVVGPVVGLDLPLSYSTQLPAASLRTSPD
ncbi:ubiquitin-like-conjugating enzyme ATG10 [Polymixia lowei]